MLSATPTQPKCFGEKGSVVLSTPTGGTGTITFNATATDLDAGRYTYTTDANGCSKSITVTINKALMKSLFLQLLLNPNVLMKRIGSFKHTNWGTGTYFNATATTNLDAGNILTPLLMRTAVLNQ
jgi:hypothetical protein